MLKAGKNPKLRPKKFSKLQLLLFVIAFAACGGYILIHSFAASNPNLAGDLNNDNTVNAIDLSLLLSNYGTSSSAGDANSDGTVNAIDLSIVLTHYGQTYAGGSFLFDDEFSGTAGSAPDPAKWVNVDNVQYGGMTYSKAANSFLDGNGDLDLRITRESWNGKIYAGSSIGTYQYQTGWPPANIKASWPAPFRYEARFKMPNVDAAWPGPGWNQNVDRPTTQTIYELDIGESRSTLPTFIGANQHAWLNGADTNPQGGGGSVSDARFNWHVVRADVTAGSVTYYIDGTQVASYYGVSGRFGVQLLNEIADPGTWAADGAQPAAGDPGPWDMLVDYVRVSAL